MNKRCPLPSGLALLLGLASLTACATIAPAPEGSPRVEAEVVLLVNQSVRDALSFDRLPDTAQQRFAMGVASLTDLGTRFYAVPTEAYAAGHVRPDYILTVELVDVTPRLEEETIEVGEEEQLATHVAALGCTVRARVERRRANAPTLPVAHGEGHSELSLKRVFKTERGPSPMISLRQRPATGEELEIRADDFDELVERTALQALRQLEAPVDRELSLRRE